MYATDHSQNVFFKLLIPLIPEKHVGSVQLRYLSVVIAGHVRFKILKNGNKYLFFCIFSAATINNIAGLNNLKRVIVLH